MTLTLLSLSTQLVFAQDYSGYGSDNIKVQADGSISSDTNLVSRDYNKHEYKFVSENKSDKSKIVQELKIDHQDKVISRITHRSYNKEKNTNKDADDDTYTKEDLVTYSLNKEGKPTSITKCSKGNNFMYFGKTMTCMTINKALCDYLKTPTVTGLLDAKIQACTDAIEGIKTHQQELLRLTGKDYENDIGAISKMNGRLSKEKSIFNTDIDSVSSLTHITNATNIAAANCKTDEAKLVQISPSDDKTDNKKNKKRFFNVPFVKGQ